MHPSPVARLFDEQPLHPEADRSPTLAARHYVDPEIFEAEKEAIFYRSWQFAAHRSRLDAPGKFVTTRIHDQEIFLICNAHGEIRAFYNACAHRAHPLVEGQGRKQRLVCPYHAWTYDLDGRLEHARGTQAMAHFERDAICLSEVRTEWLLDFAFVNLDDAAPTLAAQAPGLADDIRAHLPMYDDLVARGERSFVPPETRANWKVVVDNFLECYHCRTAHPTFSETLDVSQTDITVEGIVSRQSMPVSDAPGETPYVVDPDEPVQLGVFWFIWPNTSILLPPGPPSLYLSRFAPVEPERTVRHFFGVGTPGEVSDAEQARDHWASDFVGPEDIRLCEAVQRGLRQRGYNQGRYVIDAARNEWSEHALHHFHRQYLEHMAAGSDHP